MQVDLSGMHVHSWLALCHVPSPWLLAEVGIVAVAILYAKTQYGKHRVASDVIVTKFGIGCGLHTARPGWFHLSLPESQSESDLLEPATFSLVHGGSEGPGWGNSDIPAQGEPGSGDASQAVSKTSRMGWAIVSAGKRAASIGNQTDRL
jgi:hypothetical protein